MMQQPPLARPSQQQPNNNKKDQFMAPFVKIVLEPFLVWFFQAVSFLIAVLFLGLFSALKVIGQIILTPYLKAVAAAVLCCFSPPWASHNAEAELHDDNDELVFNNDDETADSLNNDNASLEEDVALNQPQPAFPPPPPLASVAGAASGAYPGNSTESSPQERRILALKRGISSADTTAASSSTTRAHQHAFAASAEQYLAAEAVDDNANNASRFVGRPRPPEERHEPPPSVASVPGAASGAAFPSYAHRGSSTFAKNDKSHQKPPPPSTANTKPALQSHQPSLIPQDEEEDGDECRPSSVATAAASSSATTTTTQGPTRHHASSPYLGSSLGETPPMSQHKAPPDAFAASAKEALDLAAEAVDDAGNASVLFGQRQPPPEERREAAVAPDSIQPVVVAETVSEDEEVGGTQPNFVGDRSDNDEAMDEPSTPPNRKRKANSGGDDDDGDDDGDGGDDNDDDDSIGDASHSTNGAFFATFEPNLEKGTHFQVRLRFAEGSPLWWRCKLGDGQKDARLDESKGHSRTVYAVEYDSEPWTGHVAFVSDGWLQDQSDGFFLPYRLESDDTYQEGDKGDPCFEVGTRLQVLWNLPFPVMDTSGNETEEMAKVPHWWRCTVSGLKKKKGRRRRNRKVYPLVYDLFPEFQGNSRVQDQQRTMFLKTGELECLAEKVVYPYRLDSDSGSSS